MHYLTLLNSLSAEVQGKWAAVTKMTLHIVFSPGSFHFVIVQEVVTSVTCSSTVNKTNKKDKEKTKENKNFRYANLKKFA